MSKIRSKRNNFKYREYYISVYGDIPKEYDVHHVNWDYNDNSIDNLVAISRSQHHWIHNARQVNPWMHSINWRTFQIELDKTV